MIRVLPTGEDVVRVFPRKLMQVFPLWLTQPDQTASTELARVNSFLHGFY